MGDDRDPTLDDDDLAKKIIFQNAIQAAGWSESRDAGEKIAAQLPELIKEVRQLNVGIGPSQGGPTWMQSRWSLAGVVSLILVVALAVYVPLNTRIAKLEKNTAPTAVVVTSPAGTTSTTSTTLVGAKPSTSLPGTTITQNNNPTPTTAGSAPSTTTSTTTTTTRPTSSTITLPNCPRLPIC